MMKKLRGYLCFKASSSIFPSSQFFFKLPSWFWHKPKGTNGKGLVTLHKDMESCAGYTDIEIMWDMIHSSCSKDAFRPQTFRRPQYSLLYCFKPSGVQL